MNISPKPNTNTLPNEQVKTADYSITSVATRSNPDEATAPLLTQSSKHRRTCCSAELVNSQLSSPRKLLLNNPVTSQPDSDPADRQEADQNTCMKNNPRLDQQAMLFPLDIDASCNQDDRKFLWDTPWTPLTPLWDPFPEDLAKLDPCINATTECFPTFEPTSSPRGMVIG